VINLCKRSHNAFTNLREFRCTRDGTWLATHARMRLVVVVATLLFGSGCTLVTGTNPSPDGGSTDDAAGDGGGGGGGLLAVDCKSSANLHTQACTSPTTYDKNTTIGTGPHFVDTLDVVHRGFTDKTRIIATLGTATGGVVLAVDVTTGNRTVIASSSVGTGGALPNLSDVTPGPDGWYALANGSVWKIDPTTGNHSKVWDTTVGDAHCTFLPAAQILYPSAAGGIAVGADAIYLPITTTYGTQLGSGVIAVKGTTCKLVSHAGYPTSANHGTGPDVIGIKDQLALSGTTLTILDSNQVGTVDLTTGNRKIESNDTTGSGPQIGSDSMALTTNGFAWTACSYAGNGTYVKVDLASGARTGLDPALFTPLSVGGPWCTVWAHPTEALLVIEDANGFSLFDPATGNSNVFSY
jgi:hypothetical protein